MTQNDVHPAEGWKSHGGEHRKGISTSDQRMEVEEMGTVEEEGNGCGVMQTEEAREASTTGSTPGGPERWGPLAWMATESRDLMATEWAEGGGEIGSATKAPISTPPSALMQASKKRGKVDDHRVGELDDHDERGKIQKQGKCKQYEGENVTRHGSRGGGHRGCRSEVGEGGIRPHGGEQCRPQRRQRRTRSLRTTIGCEETRAGGALCQHALSCPNRLPTQAESKVQVAERPGQGYGVRASASIATGEVITGFGDTRVLTAETGGLASATVSYTHLTLPTILRV